MLGATRNAISRLNLARELQKLSKATHFTYGPPRYRQSLPMKIAIFSVMAAIFSAPMVITIRMVPILRGGGSSSEEE